MSNKRIMGFYAYQELLECGILNLNASVSQDKYENLSLR